MNYNVPLRVAIGGNVNSGKTTFISYLKTGKLDDGNGLIRQNIFNYPHEKKTGRTSSVAQRSLIIENKKIIFFDLAGHEKYFRTTLFGISSSYPDLMLVLIESNRGVQQMTKEHIISAIYLRIPIVLVMTKIDMAIQNKLNNNIRTIKKMMKSAGKYIYEINNEKNIDLAISNFNSLFNSTSMYNCIISNFNGCTMATKNSYRTYKFFHKWIFNICNNHSWNNLFFVF